MAQIILDEGAAAATPATGKTAVYVKTDGKVYAKDDAGTEYNLTASGSGDVVGPASSVDSEIALFNSTTGKLIKSATTTGIVKATSGVIGAASAGTDYVAPGALTSSGLTQATAKLIGRTTAGTGAHEEISVGTGLSLSAGTLSSTSAGSASTNDFRLTLTTGTPVTTADVTAAGTIYCTPYKGNQIALYSGSAWNVRTSAEFSLALSGLTSGKPYDVFCYDNGGTPTLEFLVWTNDTTRATALAYQDGILSKSGDTTRRYLGTFYTTSTTTTESSVANRYLWNYYHRVDRRMVRNESTASWTYTTNTWRQANASSSNQLNFVIGVSEDAVTVHAAGAARNSSAQQTAFIGIGLDSTTTNSATLMPYANVFSTTSHYVALNAEYIGTPSAGRHYLAWLEIDVTATGTTTWAGNQDSSISGIHGMLRG